MRIKALGIGNATSIENTSFLIYASDVYLVECPKDISKINAQEINNIILTHVHPDHLGDIFTLLLQRYKSNKKTKIYTTKEVFNRFKEIFDIMFRNPPSYALPNNVTKATVFDLDDLVEFKELKVGEEFKENGISIRIRENYHPVPAFGFIFEYDGKRLFYSGDTNYNPRLLKHLFYNGIIDEEFFHNNIDFGWDCHIILHEATDEFGEYFHTHVRNLEALPDDVKERLYLVHVPENMQTNLEILSKGKVYEI
ncbi:MAG: hypothetical protein J7K22_01145 [Nanoarchaeota archaeon]|nr:hypothetical protein [Nanoarchaeota archaeon]